MITNICLQLIQNQQRVNLKILNASVLLLVVGILKTLKHHFNTLVARFHMDVFSRRLS